MSIGSQHARLVEMDACTHPTKRALRVRTQKCDKSRTPWANRTTSRSCDLSSSLRARRGEAWVELKSDEACACAARGDAHARAVVCALLAHVVEIAHKCSKSFWTDFEILSWGLSVFKEELRALV